jgi:hypothetical protein
MKRFIELMLRPVYSPVCLIMLTLLVYFVDTLEIVPWLILWAGFWFTEIHLEKYYQKHFKR